jgi:EAL domain-containing protein (putative c-di-GMP-specific phosphodiesterase class I)
MIQGSFADARILIVDDEPANVLLLERILDRAGYAQRSALTDARQVPRLFAEVGPDLILLDLHMPYLDGFAVMETLAPLIGPDEFVPVVVLTADSTSEVRQRALAAGATDFLTKPFDATEVLLRIHNLLVTRSLHVRLRQHNLALEAQLREQAEREARLAQERRLRRVRVEQALRGPGPAMVFQPIVDVRSGAVIGMEALARFAAEPTRGPDRWFAEAAEVGLGIELEVAAVRAALAELNDLPSGAYLSVNASPATATSGLLEDALSEVPGERVVLEVTEHAQVEDYEVLGRALDVLRAQGIRLAVDDAGAGYAGLQHILRLAPDIIKLDISLTRGIDADPVKRALASSLVTFAAEIGAVITAEGVETGAELNALRELGITNAQGYYLAHPGPLPLLIRPLARA